MGRTKKPNAPKFEPVKIAGIRPGIAALGLSETEHISMLAEERGRIVTQRMVASLERLDVLQKHLGLSGKLGDGGHLLAMLISVCNKYVPGFDPQIAERSKPGPKK